MAKANDLPPAAMVACAIGESGGSSAIYKTTHCPFNLQKPAHFTWVHCNTVLIRTHTKTDSSGRSGQPMYAPFCTARGVTEAEWLADATRIWCEWVLGWPNPGARAQLLAVRGMPEAFARNLPLVGFGEGDKRVQNGDTFARILRENNLVERCANIVPKREARVSLPIPGWLPGWWIVTWRAQKFFYHFDKQQQVTWTQVPPISATMPPLIASDTGKFIIGGGSAISITWGATGSEESLAPTSKAAKPDALAGMWRGSEPLTAVRFPAKP